MAMVCLEIQGMQYTVYCLKHCFQVSYILNVQCDHCPLGKLHLIILQQAVCSAEVNKASRNITANCTAQICNKNQQHAPFFIDLIQLYCLRHVSNIQVLTLIRLAHAVLWYFLRVRISSPVDVRMCLILN